MTLDARGTGPAEIVIYMSQMHAEQGQLSSETSDFIPD